MGLLPKQGVTRTQRIIKIPKLAQRSNKLPNVAPQQQAKYSVQSYKKQPNIIKQAEAVVKPRPKRIQIGKPQRTAKNENKAKVTYYKSEISEDNKLKLKQLRNYGVGKVLIIMANGPSILNANVEILKNNPKIDIMSINKPDMRVWPSTFWLFCDQSQLRRNQELWNAYDGILINTQSIKAKHNTIHMRNLGQSIGFSKDLVNGVHLGKSSCYTAMQVAYWLNYDHVYILGCDMGTVNIDGTNMLHHYGHNPDVIHNNRIARFSEEAKSYDYAANILTPTERMKYTFCTSHNKFSFVGMFGRMSEVEAPLRILSSLG